MSTRLPTSELSGVEPTLRAPHQPERNDRPGHRVPVTIHSTEPLSREGAASLLGRYRELDITEDSELRPGTVVLVITDVLDGPALTLLRRVARADGVRAVLVIGALREAELLDVVACGISAIVWRREATGKQLARAVVAAARGDGNLPADLLGRLITQVGALHRSVSGGDGVPTTGLTARETEVLRLVADGLDTGEIAAELAYSERTIKNIMHGLTTRFHLRNRAHAVAYAMREGYI
ncbi:response regulator transcription factor [Streptomyces calidiresistens]|uniref:DNA-binding response regulator n=1 Tax=Streptomyces calidiresistens TaxID=1485586 RepID=A0A7W3XXS6_9ACTN|nr:LuxR C-terminal-related transcriptional regulator [Streptomyces calidiresistens]MBB0231096.1 DNA-binding response regulator [Streptomyces calidiresistens]